ncbi:hypothetical protein [Fibrobacter sp. UWEL]|uniref:hypothetical protein n=1 Tax=Fibrobacter sp. UWEL TaxID=1896209 RepID=UPI0009228368|nr:hypothetical protein [Fibrobacter sp. UWEL]SHL26026.1 hypothetical protein SAMN05720468_11931 [Fibrobacter sp. UWEL]
MRKLVIATYVCRALGFILILVSLFGQGLIANLFPGATTINPFFYTGIGIYAAGAVTYFFINKKERADRRRREIEEAQERAFGGLHKDGEN